jgi:hypothetical protein
MAQKRIQLSDVARKHIRILGYLVASSVLAYILSVVTGRPESIYAAPVINYLLYAVKRELDKEGVVAAIKK